MDSLGKEIIKEVVRVFKVEIELNQENCEKMAELVNEIILDADYGYCPDCDERMSDEPSVNEGYT